MDIPHKNAYHLTGADAESTAVFESYFLAPLSDGIKQIYQLCRFIQSHICKDIDALG